MSRGDVGVGVGDVAAVDVPGADLADPQALAPCGPGRPGRRSGSTSRQRSSTYSQRSLNRQRGRARARAPACEPGMPVSARAWRQVRDRVEQRPRVGVRGLAEDRVPRAQLDDLAGVHHGDPVGDVGDHGQVVGDVERRDPVAAAQLAHGLQHHALGGDVQAGGRLVEHQHLGLRQERHRQRDALHLAAGELVRRSGARNSSSSGRPTSRSPSRAPSRRSSAVPMPRSSSSSTICRPIRMAGLSAAAGSCGT